jgi:hypothetical protein
MGDWRPIYGAGWCARMAASVEQLNLVAAGWGSSFRWARARLTDWDLGSFFLLSLAISCRIMFLCRCVTCFNDLAGVCSAVPCCDKFPRLVWWWITVNCGRRRRIFLLWGLVHTQPELAPQFWPVILYTCLGAPSHLDSITSRKTVFGPRW